MIEGIIYSLCDYLMYEIAVFPGIFQFLTDFRYIQKNVKSLNQCKPYSTHRPESLKNRPKKIILHCLDRMPPKVEEITACIKREESGTLQFCINSPTGNDYIVTYECNIPVCSCPDFEKFHWPCKHILAVFTNFPENGWNSLNKLYTTHHSMLILK